MATVMIMPDWLDEISVDRYRPMARLLTENDFEFLRSQPGFQPHMAAELRLQRCRIFRGYLRSLETDFDLVCAALSWLVPQMDLRRYRILFAVGMAAVRCRLWLYRWNLGGVNPATIVQLFETVRRELRVPLTAVR